MVPKLLHVKIIYLEMTSRLFFHENIERQIVKSLKKYKSVKHQLLYIDKIRKTCLDKLMSIESFENT